MNIFFDTEFTGLHKDTTLISIGLIAGNGEKFYGEFTDYNKDQCDSWINENVIKHTVIGGDLELREQLTCEDEINGVIGNKSSIKLELEKWLSKFESIQFVSDVCHFDFVLLVDIFGDAFSVPSNISPVCHDINQDIAKLYNISEKDAFNLNREEIVSELCDTEFFGKKHNSLYDAEVIKTIYDKIYEGGL